MQTKVIILKFTTLLQFSKNQKKRKKKSKISIECPVFLKGLEADPFSRSVTGLFPMIHGAGVQVLCRIAMVVFELGRDFFFYKVWHHTVIRDLTPTQATCSNTN